jgi:hypothetical protein
MDTMVPMSFPHLVGTEDGMALLALAEGQKSHQEICAHIQVSNPHLGSSLISEAVKRLCTSGLVEKRFPGMSAVCIYVITEAGRKMSVSLREMEESKRKRKTSSFYRPVK